MKPAIGDIVEVLLEKPGMMGKREPVRWPAIVNHVSTELPDHVGLTVLPETGSGTPPAGQLWATYDRADNAVMGTWRWGHESLKVRIERLSNELSEQRSLIAEIATGFAELSKLVAELADIRSTNSAPKKRKRDPSRSAKSK